MIYIIILILILIVILLFLYRKGIINLINKYWLKINNKESYSNHLYSRDNFIYPNKNLDDILKLFSKNINNKRKIQYIIKKEVYTVTNMDQKLKKETVLLINHILKFINTNNKTSYKFMNIENMYVFTDIYNNKYITVVFFLNEVNKYSTRKVVLDYYKKDNTFQIIKIFTIQSLNNKQIKLNKLHRSYKKLLSLNKWDYNNKSDLIDSLVETSKQNAMEIKKDTHSNSKIKHEHLIYKNLPYYNPTLFNNNLSH